MNKLDNDDIRRISNELDNFYTAYKSYIYYTEVNNLPAAQTSEHQFWMFEKYLLLYSLVVNWCEVFGVTTKNNHWKEMTLENVEFTKLLYDATSYSYRDWMNYRKHINDQKNMYLSDPDQYHHNQIEIDLYGVGITLDVTHQWLVNCVSINKENLDKDILSRWPVNNRVFDKECRQDFRKIFNQPIVQ
jgi:hypothetical protein